MTYYNISELGAIVSNISHVPKEIGKHIFSFIKGDYEKLNYQQYQHYNIKKNIDEVMYDFARYNIRNTIRDEGYQSEDGDKNDPWSCYSIHFTPREMSKNLTIKLTREECVDMINHYLRESNCINRYKFTHFACDGKNKKCEYTSAIYYRVHFNNKTDNIRRIKITEQVKYDKELYYIRKRLLRRMNYTGVMNIWKYLLIEVKTRSIIKEKSNMYRTSRRHFSSSTCFNMIESEDLERFIGNRKNNYQKWDYIR